jgi:hypothetical protein
MGEQPSEQRTPHGHLVSIWMHIADKRVRKTRAQLEAYLAGPDFLASFQALDPARRLLALQAAGAALDRLPIKPGVRTVEPTMRLKWTDPMKHRLRDAARRLPDDKAIARELGLPVKKTKSMRWKLVGPRRSTPHISRRGPLRTAG